MAFPQDAINSRAMPGISKMRGRVIVPDWEAQAERIRQTLPVPTTDEDFILREDRLNSLNYACGLCPELYRCFKDGANREIVLEFLRSCHGTDEGDLWTHIIRVCNALQNALRSINVLTGNNYRWLEDDIFAKAATDANPPKKHKHRSYLGSGRNPDFVRMDLTKEMEDVIRTAHVAFPALLY